MLNNLLLKGGAADDKLYVEDVFSTYLYTGSGTGSTLNVPINNGIDLTKGGLVWTKARNQAYAHQLIDTARGLDKALITSESSAQNPYGNLFALSAGTSGYTITKDTNGSLNESPQTFASWTFRKAPKFFDVVPFVSNGSGTQTVNHSLGVKPGMIICKRTDSTSNWFVWHRANGGVGGLSLNQTNAAYFSSSAGDSTTTTTFRVDDLADASLNQPTISGASYVAYLFAHDTTADGIVQCGSFTGADANVSVTLGWEPQFLLVKRTDSTGDWRMFDNMRGMFVDGKTAMIYANTSGAEIATNANVYAPTATGFVAGSNIVTGTYIYLAIRRGPMRTPTDATKVFAPYGGTATGSGDAGTQGTGTFRNTGWPVDLFIARSRNGSSVGWWDRLRSGTYRLWSDATSAENTTTTPIDRVWLDYSNGAEDCFWGDVSSHPISNLLFRRAPGFFDVVCFRTANSTTTRSHNLGVVPELIIYKCRSTAGDWIVYIAGLGASSGLFLNDSGGAANVGGYWASTAPTSTVFTCNDVTLGSNANFVAYLFASCPGVSKVFSFTGNGSSQNIDCGFTNGARFVLIKRTDSAGSWLVSDTARGIVSGNDPSLALNSTAAEVTTLDWLDPYSAGFTVNQESTNNANVNGATYIYLSIA